MSTPLTDRITALTAQANATTGASDTTLTDAVERLIAGYNDELYSVGTEIISRYIGRTEDGDGIVYVGRIDQTTGQIWLEDDPDYPATGEKYGVSLTYIPVDESYTYTKWMAYLYFVFCYDENFNYLGFVRTPTDRKEAVVPTFPTGTKYVRLAIHSSTAYRRTIIVRTA